MSAAPRKECPQCGTMNFTGRKYCSHCKRCFYSTETTTVRKSPPNNMAALEQIARVCLMYDKGLTAEQIHIALQCCE